MSYALYSALTTAAATVLAPVVRLPRFRAHDERFAAYPAEPLARLRGHRVLWMHSASVGELLASRALLGRFRRALADWRIVLSTTSFAGRELAGRLAEGDVAVLLPFDSPAVVTRAVETLDPSLFVFTETEIWPNLLRALARRGVPAVLVSGRVSERSFRRYRWIRAFLGEVLGAVARFGMQTEGDAERIRALGAPAERVSVTGSLKSEPADPPPPAVTLDVPAFWVAASTHAGEELACVRAQAVLAGRHPGLRLLLAPRHLDRVPEVETMLRREGVSYALRSALAGSRWSGAESILVLDTLGELAGLYRGAVGTLVGGTLVPIGGHNLLEPARAGVPVLFGPHVANVAEVAHALVEAGGGLPVRDADELALRIGELVTDPRARAARGGAAARAAERGGALEANFRLASEVLA